MKVANSNRRERAFQNHEEASIDTKKEYDNLRKIIDNAEQRSHDVNANILSKESTVCDTIEDSLDLIMKKVQAKIYLSEEELNKFKIETTQLT